MQIYPILFLLLNQNQSSNGIMSQQKITQKTQHLQAPVFWEKRGSKALLLWPVSLVFGWLTSLRKALYATGILRSQSISVPLVIVGNIRVGGTGKTPTVLAIAKALHAHGFKPGIISRGYQSNSSNAKSDPKEVTPESLSSEHGDEPCYMAQQLAHQKTPVMVHGNRVNAAKALLIKHPDVNVIISDDGLQHYKLKRWPAREGGRDIELVIRDGRGEGNQWLMPAGPLRENSHRPRDFTLNIVGTDATTSKALPPYLQDAPNFAVPVKTDQLYQLTTPSRRMDLNDVTQLLDLNEAPEKQLLAAAGLGNPKKFFDLLRSNGLKFQEMALPDHFDFSTNPFKENTAKVILITEKDAVKCKQLNDYKDDERIWILPITVDLPNDLVVQMVEILKRPKP
jgi:tetraacyldisaccharide 4'-kinase